MDDIARARLDAEDKLHLKAADTLHRELLQELDRCVPVASGTFYSHHMMVFSLRARRAARRAHATGFRSSSEQLQMCLRSPIPNLRLGYAGTPRTFCSALGASWSLLVVLVAVVVRLTPPSLFVGDVTGLHCILFSTFSVFFFAFG